MLFELLEGHFFLQVINETEDIFFFINKRNQHLENLK